MRGAKKQIALLMAMVMIVSSILITGCGKKKEETVTLTVYSQLANYSGDQIGWFAKVLLDKFNVKINIVNDVDGVFETRMESGNLGDIVVFGNDADDYLQAVEKGMLYDWNEEGLLEEYGPYINENMKKALEKNAGLSPDKTTVYGFGHNVAASAEEHEAFFYHPDIRWDLYAKLGYPKVTTLEDYIPILEDMKELEPVSDSGKETYGVSLFNDWDGDMVMFVKATTALYGYDEFGIGLYDVENQTWESCLKDGGMYLRSLAFYNQLYQKDLLDPDSMTQKSDGASEDYQDGVAFFNIFNFVASIAYNTEAHKEAGKAMYALSMDDAKTITYGLNVYGGSRVWTIGANTQYPEKSMEILNWLSTPEGRMVSEYGPQGITWDYNEEGNAYFTELGLACNADKKKTELTGDYSGTFADGAFQINNTTWTIGATNPESKSGERYDSAFWASYNAQENYDILNDWREYTGFTTQDEYLDARNYVVAVGTTFSMAPRGDELDITWAQVTDTIKNYTWKAIFAETDDEYNAIVAEMQTKAAEYGSAECEAFVLEQAEIRKAAEDAVKK
ncbi:MAG: type 2 periplasmic-binding domain-containing protein [Mobilitalea sp.]